MDETKSATVKVEALKAHSYNGKNYAVGDTYDIDAQYVDSVFNQGMAVRVDRVAHAKAEAKAAESNPKPAPVSQTLVTPTTPVKAPKAPKAVATPAKAKAKITK